MAYTSEIEKLERRVQENPQGRFFASLADAYRKDGQVARALEVLQTGLMIHPDYVSARVVLGRCLLDQGDDAGAEAAFTRVTELDGESVIALKALADITERRGDFASAAKWARQLLSVDPGSDDARDQLARVEQQAGAPVPAAPAAEVPLELQDLAQAAGVTAEPVEIAPPAPIDLAPPVPMAPEPAPEPEPVVVEPPPARRDSIRFEPSLDTAARTLEITLPGPAPEPEPVPELPTLRLSGMETTAVEPEPPAAAPPPEGLAIEGFETAMPATVPAAPPSGAVEGLESTHFDAGEAVERAAEIELQSAPANEFQQPDDASDLTAGASVSEFQEPSAADTLSAGSSGRISGVTPMYEAALEPEEPAAPGAPEPEPVVTEAMAVLYESQGHTAEALAVYRQLLQRSPGDGRLAGKVQELEGASAPTGATAWLAAETGGVAVGPWLQSILAARLPDVALPVAEATAMPAAEPAPAVEPMAAAEPTAPPAGTPTRPAADALSLGAIFGDEPAAPPAEAPAAGSFDDFFGGSGGAGGEPATPRPRTIRHAQPDDDDLGQFQDWLKNLKK